MSNRSTRSTTRGRGGHTIAPAHPSSGRKRTASAADETINKRTRRSSGRLAESKTAQEEEEGGEDEDENGEDEGEDDKEGDKEEEEEEEEGESEEAEVSKAKQKGTQSSKKEVKGTKGGKGKAKAVDTKKAKATKSDTKLEGGSSKKKLKKERKSSAQKAAEVAALEAGPQPDLTQAELILKQGGDTIQPPKRPRSANTSIMGTPLSLPSSRARREDEVSAVSQTVSAHTSGKDEAPLASKIVDQKILKTHSDADKISSDSLPQTKHSGQLGKDGKASTSARNENEMQVDIDPEQHILTAKDGDTRMASPPLPEGSSRSTGGYLRGHAYGNVFTFADNKDTSTASAELGLVKGTVFIYSSGENPAVLDIEKLKPTAKVPVTVNVKLAPILEQVAQRYPPIKNQMIFVWDCDDNLWEAKGPYNDACKFNDDVTFDSRTGKYLLSILHSFYNDSAFMPLSSIPPSRAISLQAESVPSYSGSSNPVSSRSVSETGISGISAPATTSSQAIASGSSIKSLTRLQQIIVDTLEVDIAMTKQVAPDNIHDYYQRYCAVLAAIGKFKTAAWTDPSLWENSKHPSQRQVVEVFIGHSQWHNTWVNVFGANGVEKHPEMRKWLEKDPTAKSTLEIWGVDDDNVGFIDLEKWLAACDTSKKSGVEKSGDEEKKKKKKKKKNVTSEAR